MADPRPHGFVESGVATVDRAVRDWFDRSVDIHVVGPTSQRVKVPVVIASGERWISARDDRGIRDARGRLILPILGIRRSGVQIPGDMSSLGVDVPSIQVARRVSDKASEAANAAATRDPEASRRALRAVYDVSTIERPTTGVAEYELVAHAQYISQVNSIVEQIASRLDFRSVPSFTAPAVPRRRAIGDEATRETAPERGSPYELRRPIDGLYYVGFLDPGFSDSGNFDEFTDEERIVRWTTTARVPFFMTAARDGGPAPVQTERTSLTLSIGEDEARQARPGEIELLFGPGW